MNREETLALYERAQKEGIEVWNDWANELLEERKRLEEAGEWSVEKNFLKENKPKNKVTKNWFNKAKADFSSEENPTVFKSYVYFSDFIFPGNINFDAAKFNEHATFESATINGYASFNIVNFKRQISFSNTTFYDQASFDSCTFEEDVSFESATFNNKVWFDTSNFKGEAWFKNATFNNRASFITTSFLSNTWFQNTSFQHEAVFQHSIFHGFSSFTNVNFSNKAFFEHSKFKENVDWEGSTFNDYCTFINSYFEKSSNFANIVFNKATSFKFTNFKNKTTFQLVNFNDEVDFSNSSFSSGANFSETFFNDQQNFRSIKAKDLIDFSSAVFSIPPDFSGTDSTIPISIDNVVIRIPSLIAYLLKKIDPSLATRFRRYKSFAISDNDNFSEHNFFVGELVGTILQQYGKVHLITFFGCLYELFSNFGRSIVRPLGTLLLLVILMTGLHLTKSKTPLTYDKAFSAGYISTSKSIFNLGADPTKRSILKEKYSALYGANENQTPNIPKTILIAEMGQTLLSAILIFLALLGIRNNFKLK
ncbi:MAG: pentapeptide repeat-containing protein [Rhizobiales bacterium]|nr:pentapeptide repeat-containing protein [Hyphomicrobiales bacterium]